MFICVGGDTHGALDRFYADVDAFEASLSIRFDWVLQVGDFGIWPDPACVDRATRNHDGAGDFGLWLAEQRSAPRPTVFIKGNHEDFAWLEAQHTDAVLPNLTHLRNGCTMDLPDDKGDYIRIGGVGGCYGPSNYDRPSRQLKERNRRHYTLDEIEQLQNADCVDIVLTHDAPAGVQFPGHHRRRGYTSNAAGLDTLLARVRPRVAFFGHHHMRVDTEIHGVRCVGLNKVAMPGNLVAIDIEPGRQDWTLLGEWGHG